MTIELYKKYRPKKLSDLVGQAAAVNEIQGFLDNGGIPHALLLCGPSGCGKTTAARILRIKLGCSKVDFEEKNCADFRGIDTAREIRSKMGLASLGGKCKVYYLDEAHQATGPLQDAMLKMLEDTPEHVYFMLATTDPEKLKKTIRTRCTTIQFQPLTDKEMTTLLHRVLEQEGVKVSDEVLERIVDVAGGSAREALVILNKVYRMKDEEKQLESVFSTDTQEQAIKLARALLDPRCQWSKVAALLKTIKEEPESLRHMVLSYMSSVLLGGGKMASRAYFLIRCFEENYFDSKRAGLIASCWEAVNHK